MMRLLTILLVTFALVVLVEATNPHLFDTAPAPTVTAESGR